MKIDYCEKCKRFGEVEKHHILPQSTFGKNDEIAWLCPNCHSEYHSFLGRENLKNTDIAFHFYNFWKWLAGLTLLAGIGFVIWNMI